jgi:restriction system protein
LQRQIAAQRREAERRAREEVRLAKEQERLARERYLAARQQEADAKTNLVEVQVRALDEILTSILTLEPLTFERLMSVPRVTPFQPGAVGTPLPTPDWNVFAPPGAQPAATAPDPGRQPC